MLAGMAPGPDRQRLLSSTDLTGRALCQQLSDHTDAWLAALFDSAVTGRPGAGSDVALVAVGGYGRRELSPQSDIDVLLVTRRTTEVAEVAEKLWYPVWDEGLKLGHAVRSLPEAVSLAESDLDTATSMLVIRHLAGDRSVTDELALACDAQWQKGAARWLAQLSESVRRRHDAAGDTAFLLEPDLKDGRGGLRDVHAVHWAEAARSVMLAGDDTAFTDAYGVLLDARVELHRRTGRPGNVLLLQEQDAVAAALGFADTDVFMRRLSGAARTIAWRSDEVWERVDTSLAGNESSSVMGRLLRRRGGSTDNAERTVDAGVVVRDGRVHLADTGEITDPLMVLRIAAVAATEGVRIDRASLQQLAAAAPRIPEPWPPEARDLFTRLWLAGPAAIDVVESLDQVGLWSVVIPEWGEVRSKPQRNAYHTFTVDRHLCQTAANAAALADRVDRPDLLVTGALLHDIGKGRPGDHTDVGIDMVHTMGPRMGFNPADVDVLVDMVRHHLLLPDVATRRDLDDDDTIDTVATQVGSRTTLQLLGALTEADSLATGPAAWNDWKQGLVRQLVARTDHVLAGGSVEEMVGDGFPTAGQMTLMAAGEQVVAVDGDTLTVVAPDRPGLFARVAGVLAIGGLDVLAADVCVADGMALDVFQVAPPGDPDRAWERVTRDLDLALGGQFALTARLAARTREYSSRRRRLPGIATPAVRIDNDATRSATVVEVVADDEVGLLATVAQTLAELGLDIRSAKVQTLGPQVVDTFYVVDASGKKITAEMHLAEVRKALGHVLGLNGQGL